MLVWDHEPFTRNQGAHEIGPRVIPDGMTRIVLQIARCTTARPDIWPDAGVEIACCMFMRIDGGPKIEGPCIGHISADAFDLFTSGQMTAAQLIAAGKLQFGAIGGIRVNARGQELAAHVLTWDIGPGTNFVGVNRTATIELGVRGGSISSEATLEAT